MTEDELEQMALGWFQDSGWEFRHGPDLAPEGDTPERADYRQVIKQGIARIKKVAGELLATLKAEKLRIDHWREKEATRDAVRVAIKDFLWDDATGLPVENYTEEDVEQKTEDVFRHVWRVYPTMPSPVYAVG